jgi:hypothetical protein
MNNSKTFFKFTILSFLLFSFSSCMNSPESLLSQLYGPIFSDQPISRQIYAKPTKDENQLLKFFISKCPSENYLKAKKIAKIYIEECAIEGINSDVAFVQMCLETNFLRYRNLVKKEWNNFCGLGAIDKNNPGLKFDTMRLGVRAHVQHLHAYATTSDILLKQELIDPRYKYVNPRGKSPDIFGLSGTWASDKQYSEKLERFLQALEQF